MTGWTAAWPHLRAALVLVHAAALLVAASPSLTGGMVRASWADPTVAAELDAWHGVATTAGWDVSREEFEDQLWAGAVRVMAARQVALAPVRPYLRYAGTEQPWRMFVAPQRFPSRLWVEVEQDGEFTPVYVARDPEHTWNGALLDHDRMRTLIFLLSWKGYEDTYARWGEWLAPQAAADFPAATRLRTRFARQRSPTPAEVRRGEDPPVSFRRTQVLDLEAYR